MTATRELPETVSELRRAWEHQGDPIWRNEPDAYRDYGRKALELGQPALAYDILSRGVSLFPEQTELAYWVSLALARGGSTRAASTRLDALLADLNEGHPLYSEAMSLAGRLAKDRWSKLPPGPDRESAAIESAARYRQAFETNGDYFPGINAATMNLVAGNKGRAKRLAEQVFERCRSEVEQSPSTDYWLAATLGEACLLTGREEDAIAWYRRAAMAAAPRYGDIASMRRQVKLLSSCLEFDTGILDAIAVPNAVTFTGHMIDHPGRTPSRFPPALESAVRSELDEILERLDARFGFCSAACGGDILFIEAMVARGGEAHVVLPFAKADFIETSVRFAGEAWVGRFEAALATAASVRYATMEGYLDDDILFRYAADLISGLARLHARQIETEPVLVAVLELDSDANLGGARETVERWRQHGLKTEVLDLGRIRGQADRTTADSSSLEHDGSSHERARSGSVGTGIRRQVQTMLFADVVGFSKLGEEAAPSFFVEFLGTIAEVISETEPRPAFSNTWGDGLYLVFDHADAAARFALRLRDAVLDTDWEAVGLPGDTSIRIALHAGPVYRALDPIIERENYFGSQVNRAARIEPVTTPGAVYVSEQTACLLAAGGHSGFTCDYLGVMELAKRFGSGALYRLRRANETE